MRQIDGIVIHYLATPPEWHKHFPTVQDVVEEVRRWHLDRGWRDIGYHDVVDVDGSVGQGRPIEEPGAHTRGHNARTIGIAYVGGLDEEGNAADTRTKAQKDRIRRLVHGYRAEYGDLWVSGHRDLGATECPGYDATVERKSREVATVILKDADGHVIHEWHV